MQTIPREEWDRFIASCISKGWTVRAVSHPKSQANWGIQRSKRIGR